MIKNASFKPVKKDQAKTKYVHFDSRLPFRAISESWVVQQVRKGDPTVGGSEKWRRSDFLHVAAGSGNVQVNTHRSSKPCIIIPELMTTCSLLSSIKRSRWHLIISKVCRNELVNPSLLCPIHLRVPSSVSGRTYSLRYTYVVQ